MVKTFAIVGCGRLGEIVVKALKMGFLAEYKLIATYSRTFESARELAGQVDGCCACWTVEDLIDLKPDFIVEAASPSAMKSIAVPALKAEISLVTLSIGAFADDVFYSEVVRAADESGARVYIASGATGGFDVLRTAALMGEAYGGAQARFFNEKGPNALRGTSVYDESLQNETRVVFEGTAKEAIAMFPTKVNVTVAASRASVGPENMHVTMRSTPGFIGDTQKVEISNDQVRAVVDVYSATPEIAAWSVVAVLRNIVSPIVF